MQMIEKILERLEEELDESGVIDDDDYFLGKYTAYNDAISIVKEESQNGGWIPCSERLPEPNKAVLVSTDTGEVDIDYYGYWCKDFIGLKGTEVLALAWMPLPDRYKGE